MRRLSLFVSAIALVLASACLSSSAAALRNSPEPPVIPIGLDAYRMWDQWPVLRIGQRTYMHRPCHNKRGVSTDIGAYCYVMPKVVKR